MAPAQETTTQTLSPTTTCMPITEATLSQLPGTPNVDNYLWHHYNFEKLVVGLPTASKDMGRYCTEWQTAFDAAKT
ncbi:hypothetical protein ACJZ2D_014763 [Fusarium nematophilum]